VEILLPKPSASKPRSIPGILVSAVVVLGLLYFGRTFWITLISGVILAFILEPAVCLVVRLRLPRGVASFVVCSLSLLVLYLAGLGVWSQALGLWDDLPRYSQRINQLVDTAALKLESVERSATELLVPKRLREAASPAQPATPAPGAATKKRRAPEPAAAPPLIQEVRIREDRPPVVNEIYSWLWSFYDVLVLASFIPFLVYFMLSWRDHIRRAWLNLFAGDKRELAANAWRGIADSARAYVTGNFLLGIVLSVVSAIFFWAVNLPYWQLVGPLSGFLSLIPYLGLPLSVLPPFFAALPVYTDLPPYLLIGFTVALFHLLALNLLYPKLVGGRVHLNPLVVTIALMLWYVLWGGAGLILAIPITAGMKAVFDSIPSLRGLGRLLGD
jgi:predicted PurR-regulated permease PerM